MSGIEIIISWSGGDRSLLVWLDWRECRVLLRDTQCYRWCFEWEWRCGSAKYDYHWEWVREAYSGDHDIPDNGNSADEGIPF